MDFAIIGAQKSASTSLQAALSDHPSIWMPHGETAVFESAFYSKEAVEREEKSWPRRSMSGLEIGIKRPDYLCLPEAPVNIGRHYPTAKFIVVLRNPVDRALSAYYHYARSGLIPVEAHDRAIDRLLDDWERAPSESRRFEILKYGLYGEAIERWFGVFAPEQIRILKQEELVRSPSVELRAIFEWLDVDATVIPHMARQMEGSFNPTRLAIQSRMRHVLFREVKNERRVSRMALATRAWNAVDNRVLAKFLRAPRPELSEQTRRRLAEFYSEDLEKLKAITSIDTGNWN